MTTIVFDAFEAWKFGGRAGRDDPLMEEARRNVRKLIRAYEKAAQGDAAHDFLDQLKRLVRNRGAKKAFVAWTQLIEELIQSATTTYGTDTSKRSIKRAQVKGAVIRLLVNTGNVRLPVPSYIQPFVIEASVDWAIETLVLTLNYKNLWVSSNPKPTIYRNPLQWLLDRFTAWVLNGEPYARFAAALHRITVKIVLANNPLTPRVDAAVARIEKDQGGGITRSVTQLSGFADWLMKHRKQATALVVLASSACDEAERFLSRGSGAEKKEYARDMVIAFLEEFGIIRSQNSVMFYVVDAALDWFIDAIVNVFNERDRTFRAHHLQRARPR